MSSDASSRTGDLWVSRRSVQGAKIPRRDSLPGRPCGLQGAMASGWSREAADELGQGEGNQHPPRSDGLLLMLRLSVCGSLQRVSGKTRVRLLSFRVEVTPRGRRNCR
jgi:hypothetical protein